MKRLNDWLLVLSLLLTSCHNEIRNHSLLDRADSLMLEYPDSALLLLEDIGVEELTTLDCRARYALLLTQAKDKNYILHHDDSLIRIAVNFYDSTENTFLRIAM